VRIYNNIAYNNGDNGFILGAWGGGIVIENPDVENIVIRNNICSRNLTYQIVVEPNVPMEHIFCGPQSDRRFQGGIFRGDLRQRLSRGRLRVHRYFSGGFHILAGSPAIDNGSAPEAPDEDFDSNPRPQGAGYDIGAYELKQ